MKSFRTKIGKILELYAKFIQCFEPLFSTAECSWLRLAAGCAMLKICEQKGVGDVYTVEQFYNLSQLVVDDVKQVREQFVAKLHKVCLEYSKYVS